MDFTTLLEYAETDAQRRTIEAAIEHGSGGKAAEALGMNKSCVNRTIRQRSGAGVFAWQGYGSAWRGR